MVVAGHVVVRSHASTSVCTFIAWSRVMHCVQDNGGAALSLVAPVARQWWHMAGPDCTGLENRSHASCPG